MRPDLGTVLRSLEDSTRSLGTFKSSEKRSAIWIPDAGSTGPEGPWSLSATCGNVLIPESRSGETGCSPTIG